MTGKFCPCNGAVNNRGNTDTMEKVSVKARWKEYVEDLYAKDDKVTSTFIAREHISESEILKSEVITAMGTNSGNKAPGDENIPIVLLKATGTTGIKIMMQLCRKVRETCRWPRD